MLSIVCFIPQKESNMKKTKGLYRIVIQQEDGSWRDSGEGPFDTYREAEEFQKNEVGMRSEVVNNPRVEPIIDKAKGKR